MARNYQNTLGQYAYASALWISQMPFSVSAWVYPTTLLAGQQVVLSLGGASGSSEYFLFNILDNPYTSGTNYGIRMQVAAPGAVGWPYMGSGLIAAGQWNHIAGSATLAQRVGFVNGSKFVDPAALGQFTPGQMVQSNIGAYAKAGASDGSAFMNGRIAEVAIWNVALTDDELIALSKRVSPLMVRRDAIVAYYPLFAERSDLELDRWRYMFHLNTVNAPTKGDHVNIVMPSMVSATSKANIVADLRASAAFAFTGTATLGTAPMPALASAGAVQFTMAADMTVYRNLLFAYASQVNKTVGPLISPE